MTSSQLSLTGRDYVDVREHHDAEALIAALQDAWARSTGPADAGLMWDFQLGPDDWAPSLMLGIRGEIGALTWYEDDDRFVPAGGSNSDWAGYWTWFGHQASMPPCSEVPIGQVYAALEELVRTHQRPTCVDWQPSQG